MDVEDQLTDLRLLTSYLENELNVVRQENADFRRDVMTSAIRNQASLSADDVSRLMDKIAELMNGTTSRQSMTRHGASSLPRGRLNRLFITHCTFYFLCLISLALACRYTGMLAACVLGIATTTTTTTTQMSWIRVLPSHSCGRTLQKSKFKLLHSSMQTSADHRSRRRHVSRMTDEKGETWRFGLPPECQK